MDSFVRRRVRSMAGLAAFVVMAGFGGCRSAVPETIRIGVAVTLSGPGAHRGQDLLNGAMLAVEELNQSPITVGGKTVKFEIVAKDDKGDVDSVKKVAQELADANVQAVIGHVQSPLTQVAIPIYAARNLPHLFTSSNKRLIALGSGNTFRLVANDQVQAQALAAFSVESLHAEKIAAVVEANEFGRDLFADMAESLGKRKKAVALKLEIGSNSPIGGDAMALLRTLRPDVIVVLGREGHVLSLMEKLKAADFTDVTVLTVSAAKTSDVGAAAIPVRALYATTSTVEAGELPAGAAFLARFQSRYKSEPVWGAHYAYDAVYMLADVMRRTGSTDSRTLIERLKSAEPNPRINFQMRFNASGEQAYPAVGVYKAERGTWTPQMRSTSW